MVKNLPCSAGDTGSSPVLGTENPHAAGQLSLRATTRAFLSYSERDAAHDVMEMLNVSTKTQCSQTKKAALWTISHITKTYYIAAPQWTRKPCYLKGGKGQG